MISFGVIFKHIVNSRCMYAGKECVYKYLSTVYKVVLHTLFCLILLDFNNCTLWREMIISIQEMGKGSIFSGCLKSGSKQQGGAMGWLLSNSAASWFVLENVVKSMPCLHVGWQFLAWIVLIMELFPCKMDENVLTSEHLHDTHVNFYTHSHNKDEHSGRILYIIYNYI